MTAQLGEGFFIRGLSQTGELPATHFISAGGFLNSELNLIANSTYQRTIYFGDNVDEALSIKGLKFIQDTD